MNIFPSLSPCVFFTLGNLVVANFMWVKNYCLLFSEWGHYSSAHFASPWDTHRQDCSMDLTSLFPCCNYFYFHLLRTIPGMRIQKLWVLFKLESNCFAMSWWSLPYNANIYSLCLEPVSHPTLLGHHRAPGWAPCVIQKIPTSYLFYIW